MELFVEQNDYFSRLDFGWKYIGNTTNGRKTTKGIVNAIPRLLLAGNIKGNITGANEVIDI